MFVLSVCVKSQTKAHESGDINHLYTLMISVCVLLDVRVLLFCLPFSSRSKTFVEDIITTTGVREVSYYGVSCVIVQ